MKELFSTLLYSNTLNFLLMVVLFAVVLWKIDVKKAFVTMREEIKKVVEKSENEKKLALTELEHTKEDLQKLPQELEKIIDDAKKSAVNIAKDLETKGNDEIKKLEHQAEKAFKFEEKKFYELLASMTSNAAVDLARENVISELSQKSELHNKFIDDALNELDRVNF